MTATAARPPVHRRSWTARLMGTVATVQVIVADGTTLATGVERSVAACFDRLVDLEKLFSPWRPDSQVSRIGDGTLALAAADPQVQAVAARCADLEILTGGRFSATWRGRFDPTGYVKGWAAEEAARAHLRPLLAEPGVHGIGLNVGGDVQLWTDPDSDFTWNVGIADPVDRTRLVARIPVRNGAVATSGPGERGSHILDPRTGRPATGVTSATVVADSLAVADVWATTAVVAGIDDLAWIEAADTRSGLLVGDDGRIRRWSGTRELDPDQAGAEAGTAAPLDTARSG